MKKRKLKLKNLLIKTTLPVAVILLGLSSCKTRKTNPRIILNKQYQKEILDGREALKAHLMTSSTPGLSVSVSVNGQTVWSEGMGYASKELKVLAGPETKYRIGRTSQMFTTFLLARLQDEGKLKIKDSFYQYIPKFPKKQWDFSLYQLGVYSAGFPEDKIEDLIKNNKDNKSLKDYVRSLDQDSLVYKPDSYFMVSDYGTCLLGILAEDITRTRFSKLMKETILDTLGLKGTITDNPYYLIENRSAPYYLNYIAQLMNAPAADLRFCEPAHGFLSTADDLNKAARTAVLDTVFFKKETRDLFFQHHHLDGGYEINRGFGWWLTRDRDNRELYAQLGSTIGGSSMLLAFPDQKLVVSICSNLSDEQGKLPAQQIAEIFLKKIDPGENDIVKDKKKPMTKNQGENEEGRPKARK